MTAQSVSIPRQSLAIILTLAPEGGQLTTFIPCVYTIDQCSLWTWAAVRTLLLNITCYCLRKNLCANENYTTAINDARTTHCKLKSWWQPSPYLCSGKSWQFKVSRRPRWRKIAHIAFMLATLAWHYELEPQFSLRPPKQCTNWTIDN